MLLVLLRRTAAQKAPKQSADQGSHRAADYSTYYSANSTSNYRSRGNNLAKAILQFGYCGLGVGNGPARLIDGPEAFLRSHLPGRLDQLLGSFDLPFCRLGLCLSSTANKAQHTAKQRPEQSRLTQQRSGAKPHACADHSPRSRGPQGLKQCI